MKSGAVAGLPRALSAVDPRQIAAAVGRAHERFVSGQGIPEALVRGVVLESWRRSAGHGVDPGTPQPPTALVGADLERARQDSPMLAAMPLVRTLLTESAADAGHVVAVGDADGRLLWVEGDSRMRSQAQNMGFAEGSVWSESAAGTNAPGTALTVDAPVQIFSAEHFLGVVQPWSCAAVPVHDPHTGETIGVVDVTGDDTIASPHALTMVRATVAAIEAELRSLSHQSSESRSDGRSRPGRNWRLEVLGRDDAVLERDGRRIRLSSRHSELLLLLAHHPEGLSAARLAVLLSEDDVPDVTIRAELTRLRRILGPEVLLSRPYRLAFPVTTDIGEVSAALDRGALQKALGAYTGPPMPSSESPAVADLRADLRNRMRRAALNSLDPEAVFAYTTTADGREDVEAHEIALSVLPVTSPKRHTVEARLDLLNQSLI